jgi:YbbR domain-containing protein
MWWGVVHDPVAEIPVTARIEFHNVPDGLEISSEAPPIATVRLSGPARVVRELARNEVHPVIDLNGAHAGEITFDLSRLSSQLPRGVEVVQFVPARYHLKLEPSAEKVVPVLPRTGGQAAPGWRVAQLSAQPSQAVIRGPQSRVQAVTEVVTDPVDLHGLAGRASYSTHLSLSDPLVRIEAGNPVQLTVTTEKTPSGAR